MTLSKLIEAVGNEHVVMQNLAESLDEAKLRKGDGHVSFFTDRGKVVDMFAGAASEWVGLVVWLPRARLPKIAVTAPASEPEGRQA